jgi:hypothetical protein
MRTVLMRHIIHTYLYYVLCRLFKIFFVLRQFCVAASCVLALAVNRFCVRKRELPTASPFASNCIIFIVATTTSSHYKYKQVSIYNRILLSYYRRRNLVNNCIFGYLYFSCLIPFSVGSRRFLDFLSPQQQQQHDNNF